MIQAAPEPTTAPLKVHYNFIDILKTYAVFMMIVGHTLDAVLLPAVKEQSWYRWCLFLRGLTSASFFLASGAGLYFAFIGKRDRTWHALFLERLARIVPILVAGYFLHLPVFSGYRLLFHSTAADWRQLLQCDTLQNICYSIVILQLLLVTLREWNRIMAVLVPVTLAILGATPLIHARLTGPMVLVQLFTHRFGSLFPLFPFSAYIFTGAIVAAAISRLREAGGLPLARACLLASGAALVAVSLVARLPVFPQYASRIGLILVIVGILTWAEGVISPVTRLCQAIGRESLVVYLVHLVIVYGSVVNRGFSQLLGETLGLLPGLALALGLALVMTALGWSWHQVKRLWPARAKAGRNVVVAFLVLWFLVS